MKDYWNTKDICGSVNLQCQKDKVFYGKLEGISGPGQFLRPIMQRMEAGF